MKTEFDDDLANFVWEHAVAPMCFMGGDGTFLRVNPALADLLGYTTKELTKLRFHEITHPQDVEADQDMVEACLHGKIDGYTMTKRYITKRGESVWIRLRVDTIKDDDTGESMLFLSQITPKEDPVRMDAIMHRDGRYTIPNTISNELKQAGGLTISEVGTWLRKNWTSVTPILASIGFVIYWVIKLLLDNVRFTGG